jgi:single-stranded-DNA-specific exonuclease
MAKTWYLKPKAPEAFMEEFPEISPLLLQLLYNRGITDAQAIEHFLTPTYEKLHNPFLFKDMQRAVDRIWQAIRRQEKICIYGDYDADAVTANALLFQTFRYLGVDISSYIPDRFTEGYGLNLEAFGGLKLAGTTVVITVDCGTNSVEVAEYCQDNGIDLIITDHHEITGQTPKAYALVNPKNPADQYPDNQITGVGVAYKLAKALLSQKEQVTQQKGISDDQYVDWDKWLLDLVAIGTVADCHSLLGENRILVSLGLTVLAKTKWLGLRVLMEAAGLDLAHARLDTHTLGFMIAPRINAAGRLEHANIALQLLTGTDAAESVDLAARLENINKRRQDLTLRVVSEAKEQAELLADRKVIVVAHAEWHKGVVGLAAGKLAEIYKRPVIVLERGEVESTGSARSGNGFDIVAGLKATSHLLSRFGGHKQAAGLTLPTMHVEKFYQGLLAFADQTGYEAVEPALELAAELQAQDLTLVTQEQVEQLEPYGMGNPKPLFLVSGAQVRSHRIVGNGQKHLQLQIGLADRVVDCIGFNLAYLAERLNGYKVIDLAVELLADSWNGNTKLKLKVVDIRSSQEAGVTSQELS